MKLDNTRYVDNSKSDGNRKAFRAATDLLIMSHSHNSHGKQGILHCFIVKLSVRARRFRKTNCIIIH
jgi:hypothetical protein